MDVSNFTSPAPRRTDRGLFSNASPGLSRLMRQSRKELRQKGREEYWNAKQKADAEAQAQATTGNTSTAQQGSTEWINEVSRAQ